MTTGKDVHVNVIDGLATLRTRIRDQAKSACSVLAADLSCDLEQLCGRGSSSGCIERGEIGVVFARHHQQMRRRLRIHVGYRHDVVVAVDFLRLNFSAGDLAEDTIKAHV